MSVRVKQSSAVKNHGDHPYNNIKKPKILVTEPYIERSRERATLSSANCMMFLRSHLTGGVMRSQKQQVLLTLKSDQHLISPYIISPESHIKVMRIIEMIVD